MNRLILFTALLLVSCGYVAVAADAQPDLTQIVETALQGSPIVTVYVTPLPADTYDVSECTMFACYWQDDDPYPRPKKERTPYPVPSTDKSRSTGLFRRLWISQD